MIAVKQIGEVKKNQYDEAYAIVRSMKSKSDWLIQDDLLAPSKSLFYRYLELKKSGVWNAQSFESIYVPQFITELKADQRAIDRLNELYKKSKNGVSIALCCFCTDETLCHRSIIAGLFQGVGADVVANADYRKYYAMYKGI